MALIEGILLNWSCLGTLVPLLRVRLIRKEISIIFGLLVEASVRALNFVFSWSAINREVGEPQDYRRAQCVAALPRAPTNPSTHALRRRNSRRQVQGRYLTCGQNAVGWKKVMARKLYSQ